MTSWIPFPPGWAVKLEEIQRLLAEAYEHYFANSDGHCKSSEGAIEIGLPPFYWREKPAQPSLSIYSYVLGPSRTHYFATIDEALAAVRGWHEREMAHDYSMDGWDE